MTRVDQFLQNFTAAAGFKAILQQHRMVQMRTHLSDLDQ
jgi:hypothetical protein